MSLGTLPPEVRDVARRVLTERQLEAFELELLGWSHRRIATHMDVGTRSAYDRLKAAHRNLLKAGLRLDGSGAWHMDSDTKEAA